jgi:hypothetical protein
MLTSLIFILSPSWPKNDLLTLQTVQYVREKNTFSSGTEQFAAGKRASYSRRSNPGDNVGPGGENVPWSKGRSFPDVAQAALLNFGPAIVLLPQAATA